MRIIHNRYNTFKRCNIFDTINAVIDHNASINVLVPFVCSDSLKFTSKFIKASFQRFPVFENNFFLNKPTIGKVDFYKVKTTQNKNSIIFASMPCHHQNKNGRKINYGDLTSCMHQINSIAKRSTKTSDEFNLEIHAPKFGTGVSGGDWKIISELINDIWTNINVSIYEP